MGESADDILATLCVNEETIEFKDLLQAFNGYFNVRKNIIVERAKFNKRSQTVGETIDAFIQDLLKLADECNFGDLKEELIRDRIVVGVIDDTLTNELQSKAELTLAQAVQLSRQAEARKESQQLIRGSPSVNLVDRKPPATYNQRFNSRSQYQHHKASSAAGNICGYCGKEPHS
ncbi:uncharacterized protein LOC143288721 [Babylonia areolata]|uniref:uncharacterized protein LOC143288721 n=1 Tax=Babylonia areolata TaxID=304850 RepID=UPI003FD0AC29